MASKLNGNQIMMKKARLGIVVGVVTVIVMLASAVAIAGVFVKTDDCTLTQEGGECVCTVKAKDDVSFTSLFISNGATPGRACEVGPQQADCGFSVRDLSLDGDLAPGAGIRPGCDPSGIGRNNRAWFDIFHRIADECSSVGYSPIPMEPGDLYEITLVGYGLRGRNQGDCDELAAGCRNDILLDVRASAHGKFSLTCRDESADDNDHDDDDDDDD